MKRIDVRTFMLVLTCAALTACGNDGPVPHVSTPSAAARVHPRTEISGIISTKTYYIPEGETVTAVGPTMIFASDSITIAGKLEMNGGTEVDLFAPRFTIDYTGAIAGVTAKSKASVYDKIDSCSISLSKKYDILIPSGDGLEIASNRDDASCAVAAPNLILTGYSGNLDGRAGPSLRIGSTSAIDDIEAAAKKAGKAGFGWHAYPRGWVTSDLLAAGSGSKGAAGSVFDHTTLCQINAGGDGGAGGSVIIRTSVLKVPRILAGHGGTGGDSGNNNNICPNLQGSATRPNGEALYIAESSGGAGGNVEISQNGLRGATRVPHGNYKAMAGSGGDAGAMFGYGMISFLAGNGYGSGAGGPVRLTLGRVGLAGKGSTETGAVDGNYPYIKFIGAWGGTQASATGAGGAGGSFTLAWVSGLKPPFTNVSIVLDSFGAAGASISSCGSAGIAGANAGALHDNGAFSSFSIINEFNVPSFGGGLGGNGTPPGNGGTGGSNDEGQSVGPNGYPGTAC